MLSSLHISQYILIDTLDIEFSDGLSIISGETGAGKSILLGALGLVLGKRADTSDIAIGQDKCVVEACFSSPDPSLEELFDREDLDFHPDECIIRRELSSKGKSRAFVNDTPVSLSTLKKIGERLIDIHSQHKNLLLGDAHFQLSTLDILAKDDKLLKNYQQKYHEYVRARDTYEEALRISSDDAAEADYLKFQYDELEAAGLKENEEAELEEEAKFLTHAVEIASGLSGAGEILLESDDNVVSALARLTDTLKRLAPYMSSLAPLGERLESAKIEIQDIAATISDLGEQVDVDPDRLNFVQERLNTINKLMMKHKAASSLELLEIKDGLHKRLEAITNKDEYLDKLKRQMQDRLKEVDTEAAKLTKERKKAARLLSDSLEKELPHLGIPKVVFKVEMKDIEPGPYGRDKAIFLFSANTQQPPEAVADIASGGEIARLMLCIKSLIADKKELPTIIFDEIDTGISGDIAGRMAGVLRKMAKKMQVITITHLPQIAAAGKEQFFVYKVQGRDKTETTMKKLSYEERIDEIARMQSGSELTEISRMAASELLRNSI